ncbi:BTAD domain-containing putative transcriptional regulator [Streptomyces sp. NPDC055210]
MDGDARLRITLLGEFAAARGDRALPVSGLRLRALLVQLALAGGRTVGQGALIDAIWPDDPPGDPARALQALVSRLRRALGSPHTITSSQSGYRLDVAPAEVDALHFEELAAAGRERLRARDAYGAHTRLTEAVAQWEDQSGTEPAVLAGLAPAAATRLAHTFTETVADLAETDLALGNAAQATTRLTALLTGHRMHERGVALLMDALAAQGRQAEALARYEQFRETLADELGTEPGAALRERHLRLLRDEPPATTPSASPAGRRQEVRGNLPAPLTSFIGRDDDLARIESLLTFGRLVTVLGPGGAGKTRLAIEAARRRRPHHRDGTWLIDLASVTDAGKIGGALLVAIGLRGSALFDASVKLRTDPADELDALSDELDGRETLLVVDNCEHLIDAVAHLLAALLERCCDLRVLATSREALAIPGEALVPLGPLPLPAPDADLEQTRRTPSVRLFTERAAAVVPGFDVDEHNQAEIVRIVRSLDGLPLALELAAARLRTLSLTGLADGLPDRFRLLTTGSRTAFPRHRTLRGVIAWSWDLLTDQARTLAERIAVLPGGVTPASAAALCTDTTTVAEYDVPELLSHLVDRSLLQLAPDSGRYRMLETIREYGLEKLAEHRTLTHVRDLAARYGAELVAEHDPLTRGPQQLHALHVLRAEHDNVLAALRHLCDSRNADGALRLALGLIWYWRMRGQDDDAAYWLGQATAIPTGHRGVQHDIATALHLLDAPYSALFNDVPPDADETVRVLTERLLNHPGLPGFTGQLMTVALACLHLNDGGRATLQRLADGPDVWLAGHALISRAHATENEGDLDRARTDVSAALDRFAEAGDRWATATALPLRALLRQYDGELDGAVQDLQAAKETARAFGALSIQDEIYIALRLTDLHTRTDQPARALELITTTRQRVLASHSPGMAIILDACQARLHLQTGDLAKAGELLDTTETALSHRHPLRGDHEHALIATVRAELCLHVTDRPAAARALHLAYTAAVNSHDLPIVATVAVSVAHLAALDERYHDVAVVLGAAARLRGAHDPTEPRIRTLSARARTEIGDQPFEEAYTAGWDLKVTAALQRADPALQLAARPPG